MRLVRPIVVLVLAVAALVAPARTLAFKLTYEHYLSTPGGRIRTDSVWLSWDAHAREVSVVGYGLVRVFNSAGMEVYRFGEDVEVGSIRGVAALESGDLVVLAFREGKTFLLRANFRGEVLGRLELTGVPDSFAGFQGNRLLYADHKLFLVDEGSMRLLVATEAGEHVASYDLAQMIGQAEKRHELGVSGCGVDGAGRFLFTVAPLFRVHILSPDGKISSFGRSGGAPGLFNIVAGVGADEEGRIYVVDSLKGAVLVFDPDFRFLGEFGYRGPGPGNLVRPTALVVGGDRIYVSQGGTRGVSVFRIEPDPPRASKAAAAGR